MAKKYMIVCPLCKKEFSSPAFYSAHLFDKVVKLQAIAAQARAWQKEAKRINEPNEAGDFIYEDKAEEMADLLEIIADAKLGGE